MCRRFKSASAQSEKDYFYSVFFNSQKLQELKLRNTYVPNLRTKLTRTKFANDLPSPWLPSYFYVNLRVAL